MKIVTCPDEPSFHGPAPLAVFLAGGITGCPDWQSEFSEMVKDDISDRWVLLNPRRAEFDVSDPSMSEAQIDWEHKWLERAAITVFWFPAESVCPITLFELGRCIGQRRRTIVATHPDYPRRFDVVYQYGLRSNPWHHLEVGDSLDWLHRELVIQTRWLDKSS